MTIVPLDIPPGMYKNGTDYSALARWTSGNMVRWRSGLAQPIGGWVRRRALSQGVISTLTPDPTIEAVRDIFSWADNSDNVNIVFGSNLSLTYLSQGGITTDITPAKVATSGKDAIATSGYGKNIYGAGAYGTAGNLTGVPATPPLRWAFSTWGENLLTLQRGTGPVYEYVPAGTLAALSNAPIDCQDITTTDDRIVLTIGAGGESRKVQWSDQEDNNDWTPTEANQAGDQTIAGTGKILRCVNFLDRVMLLSTTDLYVATYLGPPYVYRFDKAGEGCGPLSTECVVTTDKFMVWIGAKTFWIYDGALRTLPSDVQDFFFADIDPTQTSKISTMVNADFSEVWWLYQSKTTTTTEVDSYIAWNHVDRFWYSGKLDRTAGYDKGATLYPVMISSDGFIYNHEQADILPTVPFSLVSGPIEIGNGTVNVAVRYIFHDAFINPLTGGSVSLIGQQLPRMESFTYGPYSPATPISTRAIGRTIKIKIDDLTLGDKVGRMRIDVAPMGTGFR